MAYLRGFYLNNPHVGQFDGSLYAGENCTPTSAANGINAVTGGKVRKTGGQVRNLVKRWEEVVPATPGWAIEDVDLAMRRLYPPFPYEVRSGLGWDTLVKDHKSGLYLTVQGDSDQFSNSTCSGAFNGLHCIGISPITKTQNGEEWWWIDDPICPIGRWEKRRVIYAYARKLSPSMRYGRFNTPVPRTPPAVLWGPDVPAAIRAVNPSGWTVGRAVAWATGHGFGTVINMSDLKAAFKAIGLGYGNVIEPKDVQALAAKWKAR